MTDKGMCRVEGCPKKATATIYCQMHYRRKRLYGDVNFVYRIQRRPSVGFSAIHYNAEGFLEVELTQEKLAKIDSDDLKLICGKNWNWSSTTGYAYWQNISMQQMLLGKKKPGLYIDHIDRDKLNNRRENLRLVSNSINCKNSTRSDEAFGYSYHKWSGKYQAYVDIDSKSIYLGLFTTGQAASEARTTALGMLESGLVKPDEFKQVWKSRRKGME